MSCVNGSPDAFELRPVLFITPFWETFRVARNARKSSVSLWKASNTVKEIMRVCLSDNGKEFMIYTNNGETLDGVIAVTDFAVVGESAERNARDAFLEDFQERNGRDYNTCMGYSDCVAGMCDEHFPNDGAY